MCEKEDGSDMSDVVTSKSPDSDAVVLSDTVSLSDSDPEDSVPHFDPEVVSSSSGDSSDEGDPAAPGRPEPAGPRGPFFQLKGTSTGFSSRSQSIFDCLESAAKLAMPSLGDDNLIDRTFVRPLPPASRKRDGGEDAPKARSKTPPDSSSSKAVPDYLVNPERWTKYSLEDVPETSSAKNAAVAQEYIETLQQRRKRSWAVDNQEPFTPAFNQDHSSSSGCRIVFSKPGRPLDAPGNPEGQGEGDDAPGAEEAPGRGRRGPLGEKEGGGKKEFGLLHLEEPEEEENDAGQERMAKPRERARKRKWAGEDRGDKAEALVAAVGFNASRKVNRKNFRKTVGRDEED
ncbi:U5 small nuclear ribonucleoprotein TSSC4 [Lepisosteus oculatus]|uniref:U5 small nuclear ribonucleoprotein TSSC4 n=1 Tax=Lepisosteus oculatus TaxID=7918 RepID=UPI0035F520BE